MGDDLCQSIVTYAAHPRAKEAAPLRHSSSDGRHPSHQGVEPVPLPTTFCFQVVGPMLF